MHWDDIYDYLEKSKVNLSPGAVEIVDRIISKVEEIHDDPEKFNSVELPFPIKRLVQAVIEAEKADAEIEEELEIKPGAPVAIDVAGALDSGWVVVKVDGDVVELVRPRAKAPGVQHEKTMVSKSVLKKDPHPFHLSLI